MPDTKKLHVFLCHASVDKPTVRALYKRLRRGGINPWLDVNDLLPGQDSQVEIRKALDAADVIIVCISKNSITKEGYTQQQEIASVLERAQEKPKETIFIIPTKLEECDEPENLSCYWSADLYRANGYQCLMRGLKLRAEQLEHTCEGIPNTDESNLALDSDSDTSISVGKDVKGNILVGDHNVMINVTPAFQAQVENEETQNQENKTSEKVASNQHARLALAKTWTRLKTPVLHLGSLLLAGAICLTLGFVVKSFFGAMKDGMKLHFVPAGEFTMGDNAETTLAECQKFRADCQLDWFKVEDPPHKINLNAFWIDETEVTNRMYALCVAAGRCQPPSKKSSSTRASYYDDPQYANYPVIYVLWNDAKTYCAWAGRALPSEAQWEKAARGADERTYPWGNNAPTSNLLNYNRPNDGDTSEVGAYPNGASPYGALDMAGNVWEWVNDWYDAAYYASSPASNPLGPVFGRFRVERGGSWFSTDSWLGSDSFVHSTGRNANDPTDTGNGIVGFRCALSFP